VAEVDGADADDLSTPPREADSLEQVIQRAVAAPATFPALPSGTVVANRYEIERLIGAGGMGTVYLARDRTLDRPVAVKLHRTVAASERLHREAIAMAKLAHPNVVAVYETGEYEGRAFVAMEYVPGDTLRAWITGASQRRRTRDVLAAIIAAGEGLDAVHDAGLVHRDVKPDNIFVGNDGRVRIGDFGLAQLPRDGSGQPVRVAITSTTATGTVAGTPAYMAPEQIAGGEVDARTDQFALCVVAWEMLGDGRPFEGTTTGELRDVMTRGKLPAAPRIPARLRRVLARGLAADPADRWPSVRALLAALRSAERRPRIVAAVAIGALAMGGIASWALWPQRSAAAACETAGAREVEELFPPSLGFAASAAALRGGGANASTEAQLIRDHVEAYRTGYRSLSKTVCAARLRGDWSSQLASASEECTLFTARTARELLAAAPASATQPSDVLQLVNLLPSLVPCSDARLLASWRRLPADPDERDLIVSARARIDTSLTLLAIAQLAFARETLASLETGPVKDDPAIVLRLDLLRAEISVGTNDPRTAEPLLARVYYKSRERDDGAVALLAVRDLIDLTGRARRDFTAAQAWIRDGVTEAKRLESVEPGNAFAVYAAAANVIADAGDTEGARSLLDRAKALFPADDSRDITLLEIRANAEARSGNTKQALATLAVMQAKQRQIFGPKHPLVADALSLQAAYLLEDGRGAEAGVAARQAIEILDKIGADTSTIVATAEMNLGAALLELGDPQAEAHLLRARAMWVKSYGELHPDIALIDTNLALFQLDRGEVDAALTTLRTATAIQERALGPDHEELADGLYNLAVAERNAGKLDAALATARRAAEIFGKRQPGSVRHAAALDHIAMIENLRDQRAPALAAATAALEARDIEEDAATAGWARLEAARALTALHRDLPRTRQLLTEARARYDQAKLPDRVVEIDALLARLR
jgi:tRNA A-37 threonylcarbamoyl transferase component Bud32/tetratricopeptide (TPR) repeat protein